MSRIAVVGGGVAGLAAARDLTRDGCDVTLVEPGHLGGKLLTTPFDGASLDEAADAFLARVPEGVDLCRELGIAGDLVSPAVRRAYVWTHGALRPLPEAQVLGVPTDLDEVARSGLLSPAGLTRARHDLTEPLAAPHGDVAIGALIRDRLGDEVAERLVDPLVGGINAGATDELSLAATVPQLDAAARSGAPSLIAACQAQRAAVTDREAPVFFAPRQGMGALVRALADDLSRHNARIVGDRAVGLDHEGGEWRVRLAGGGSVSADGVVVATPAFVTADLLGPHDPGAARILGEIPYASVAIISLAVDRDAIDRDLDASGFLVPRVERRTVTACSWASSKWAHLGDRTTAWLRASVGRDGDDRALALGDDDLVRTVVADLADTMALRATPAEARVSRWPRSFPQYRVGHLDRIGTAEASLARSAPRVVITGAALRGLGVPACIRQGREAAGRLLARL